MQYSFLSSLWNVRTCHQCFKKVYHIIKPFDVTFLYHHARLCDFFPEYCASSKGDLMCHLINLIQHSFFSSFWGFVANQQSLKQIYDTLTAILCYNFGSRLFWHVYLSFDMCIWVLTYVIKFWQNFDTWIKFLTCVYEFWHVYFSFDMCIWVLTWLLKIWNVCLNFDMCNWFLTCVFVFWHVYFSYDVCIWVLSFDMCIWVLTPEGVFLE